VLCSATAFLFVNLQAVKANYLLDKAKRRWQDERVRVQVFSEVPKITKGGQSFDWSVAEAQLNDLVSTHTATYGLEVLASGSHELSHHLCTATADLTAALNHLFDPAPVLSMDANCHYLLGG
jgi:hypothetical protein